MTKPPKGSSFKDAYFWYLAQISKREPDALLAANLAVNLIQNDVRVNGTSYPFVASCL